MENVLATVAAGLAVPSLGGPPLAFWPAWALVILVRWVAALFRPRYALTPAPLTKEALRAAAKGGLSR